MRSGPQPATWRSLLAPAIATALACAVLVGLGVWQLERKAWKDGLLSAIASRAFGPPGESAPEADWPTWQASGDEFRRVRLRGTFRHEDEVAVHGLAELRPREGTLGFYIFTPLEQPDGSIVMVNRGFVPSELRDPATRRPGQMAGEVSVVGLVRAPETRSAFVPANDPSRNGWFVRDLAEMAKARALTRVAPFYVDADATPNPGGWPRGGQTRISLPNDHLQYALTWFGLAGALLAVFGVFAVGRLRQPAAPDLLA